jgi:hypothetical protein
MLIHRVRSWPFHQTLLTDDEVDKTFFDIEEAIRYRLRLSEIIPVEMSDYRIGEAGNTHHSFECDFYFIYQKRVESTSQ